jgi:hypothetical protein
VFLNLTDGSYANSTYWGDTEPTSTQFTVGTTHSVDNAPYVAYLFAHNNNDGEFGPDQDEDIIKCASYTGNGSSTGPVIDLGFEPQWIMIKRSSATEDWIMFDNMRGLVVGGIDPELRPNKSQAEGASVTYMDINATGFQLTDNNSRTNENGSTYIYMAIRRPQAAPPAASQVFSVNATAGGDNKYNLGFVPDLNINTTTAGSAKYIISRLTGSRRLQTDSNSAQSSANTNLKYWDAPTNTIDLNTAWWGTQSNVITWSWRRAPSYFDAVAYTGTGSARTVSHNLGVEPEMIWVKTRSNDVGWAVYHSSQGFSKGGRLETTDAFGTETNRVTAASSATFSVGTDAYVNVSARTYIAYLFATLPGVSKVGSYTGSSSAVNVDCGFTSGARFILIKRSSASGDSWFTFDSVRGIVAGNDPFLYLNDQQAEFTSYDAIDPYSAGFTVTTALAGLNANGSTYIFYAIAQ